MANHNLILLLLKERQYFMGIDVFHREAILQPEAGVMQQLVQGIAVGLELAGGIFHGHVLHAQQHLRTHPDFAASVGRQFHALFARRNWRTNSGEDLLLGAAWKYRLNEMVEEESRKNLAKHSQAAASARSHSEGRGW